jgi:SNF2 family DNA or RNA helicase
MTDLPLVVPARKLVILPYDKASGEVPDVRTHDTPRGLVFSAPHDLRTSKVLRNQGVKIPCPLETYYDWNGIPRYASQVSTASEMAHQPRLFVLNDIGTGKTRAALGAVDYLFGEKLARRALVVTTLSTMEDVWVREAERCFPKLRPSVLHGGRGRRLRRLADGDANLLIINHDGVNVIAEELERAGIDIVILDELAVYRRKRTRKWKAARRVVDRAKWAWGMTGAPTPRGPDDAWAQVELLRPGQAGNSMIRFRMRTMVQVGAFRWLPKPEAAAIVHEVMQPAVRVRRADVVELPPCTHSRRSVAPSVAQAQAYAHLKAKAVALFDEGRVRAVNAGVLYSKLLQVAAGSVYTETRGVIHLDASARYDEIARLVEEAEGKALIFSGFRHVTERCFAELSARLASRGVMVHGGTPQRDRSAAFWGLQNGSTGWLAGHPQCMAHGLTLTAANVIIWNGPLPNLEIYEQANGRITRAGQTRPQFVVGLRSFEVEARTYRMLEEKALNQNGILAMFKEL